MHLMQSIFELLSATNNNNTNPTLKFKIFMYEMCMIYKPIYNIL